MEDKVGEADVPLAMMPNLNVITLLQMDGRLSFKEFEEAVDLAIQGNKKIYKLQKDALRAKYLRPKSENSEVNDK